MPNISVSKIASKIWARTRVLVSIRARSKGTKDLSQTILKRRPRLVDTLRKNSMMFSDRRYFRNSETRKSLMTNSSDRCRALWLKTLTHYLKCSILRKTLIQVIQGCISNLGLRSWPTRLRQTMSTIAFSCMAQTLITRVQSQRTVWWTRSTVILPPSSLSTSSIARIFKPKILSRLNFKAIRLFSCLRYKRISIFNPRKIRCNRIRRTWLIVLRNKMLPMQTIRHNCINRNLKLRMRKNRPRMLIWRLSQMNQWVDSTVWSLIIMIINWIRSIINRNNNNNERTHLRVMMSNWRQPENLMNSSQPWSREASQKVTTVSKIYWSAINRIT